MPTHKFHQANLRPLRFKLMVKLRHKSISD